MCDYIQPKERKQKPYRTIRLHDPRVPAGYKQDFIVRIYRDGSGLIQVAEKGRRKKYQTTVGELYVRLVRQKAMA
jgi:hypothetical protein